VILDKAAAVLKKDLLMAMRCRSGLVLNVVSAAAQLATFYYLSRAVGVQFRPDGMPYFLFLLLGTGFYSFLMTGMYAFLRNVQEAQQNGTLEVLMATSTPPAVLSLLSTASAFAGPLMQFFIFVGAGFLVLPPSLQVNFFALVAVLMLSVLISVAIGITAAALQVSIHKGSAVLWALGSTSWLLSGTLFPVTALPRAVRIVSNLLPLTHSLNAMRLAVLHGSNSAQLRAEIETLLAFAVVAVPASILFFSWTVSRARQLGTLSFY
jgi:ABC-2 type transport system permease protein